LVKDGKCDAWFSIIQEEINDMELDDYDKLLLNKKLHNAIQNLKKGNYEDNDSQTYHLLAEFIKETQNKDKTKTHQSSKLVKSVEALMTILD
jgi:NTE family protein